MLDQYLCELSKKKKHPVPNSGPKLAAAPTTPPASNSTAPLAVRNSSFPATSSPTEMTAPIVSVPDDGGPQKREAAQIMIDKWPQPT